MAIECVDSPIKNSDFPICNKLPKGRFPNYLRKIPFLLDSAIFEFHGQRRNVIATLGGEQLRLQRGNRTGFALFCLANYTDITAIEPWEW